MDMKIDQSRANHLAGNIHHLGVRGRLAGQTWTHGRNLAVHDQNIGDGIKAIGWVYDSSTGEQQ